MSAKFLRILVVSQIVLVYANAAGSERSEQSKHADGYEERLIGRSQITVPFKGAVSQLDHNWEAMFVREIDTAILKDAEQSYEIRRDLRTKRLDAFSLNI